MGKRPPRGPPASKTQGSFSGRWHTSRSRDELVGSGPSTPEPPPCCSPFLFLPCPNTGGETPTPSPWRSSGRIAPPARGLPSCATGATGPGMHPRSAQGRPTCPSCGEGSKEAFSGGHLTLVHPSKDASVQSVGATSPTCTDPALRMSLSFRRGSGREVTRGRGWS